MDLEMEGYYSLKEIPNKGLCGLMDFVFTTGLVIGIDEVGYIGRYCYKNKEEAIKAFNEYTGEGDPTGPWIKYKGAGGERCKEQNCVNCHCKR